MPSREQLEADRTRLEQALRTERATAALERHGVPEHFAGLLSELEPDQIDAAAQAIASEIRTHPAGSPDSRDQEGEGSPTGAAGGADEGDQDLPPERLGELAAITRGGAEDGQPVDRFEAPKDRTTAAIRAAENWNELEALQAGMRRR